MTLVIDDDVNDGPQDANHRAPDLPFPIGTPAPIV